MPWHTVMQEGHAISASTLTGDDGGMSKQDQTSSWSERLASIRSAGSTAKRPGSLAGLAAARRAHKGQFFTSTDLARLVWRIGVEVPSQQADPQRRIHILDNSIGSGRLVQFAQPGRHFIGGLDVDADTLIAVAQAAEEAGLECDLLAAGMEEVQPSGFDVALINPPFSLSLASPAMTGYSCTTWGPYGPNTASLSHAYALHQALEAAPIVVAILPATYAKEVFDQPSLEMEGRVRALITLPGGLFVEESTDVAVSLLVFGPESERAPIKIKLAQLDDPLPDLGLDIEGFGRRPKALGRLSKTTEQTIPGEVTGNTLVRVVHNGRRIGLKCSCALTYAKVWNAVLGGPVSIIEGHRYPKGVRYRGQGKLDVELMLMQPDPMAAFEELLGIIRKAGAAPEVDPGLIGYLKRRIKRHARESTPYGHWIKGETVRKANQATARKKMLLDPLKWGSPLIQAGQQVELASLPDGTFQVTADGHTCQLREDELTARFHLEGEDKSEWRCAYPSRKTLFTEVAKALDVHLRACGALDVAGWDYQANDLCEVLMGRHGLITWRPGCGKGRGALALALAGGKHNLIVVESHLIDELVDQAKEAGLDPALWQVITRPEHCEDLRKINIISYGRLRRPLYTRSVRRENTPPAADGKPAPKVELITSGRRTYARILRRRFNRVIADEAHLLRHLTTAQTRALWSLSPRRRFAMTGTPMANYVQNLLPLMQWVYGDGVAIQPFGRHRAYLEPRLWNSMSAASRGVDVFAERHVVSEWVTRKWEDGLEHGAKRQVPKVNNVVMLREWAAPLMKRRHEQEPEVACHFQVPEPTREVVEIAWDPGHLAHYLRVADEFHRWYRQACDDARNDGRNVNLAMLLARIGAVIRACNTPQHRSKGKVISMPYMPLTSKQRYVVDRLEQWTEEGHKTVCYVDSPVAVDLYVRELAKRDIQAVPFHGGLPIKQRTRDMNRLFRNGPAPVQVATMMTIQNGLNIWQADRGLLASRFWSDTIEEQGQRRLLRPQQTRPVHFEFVHLEGSIDLYQAQMVRMKSAASGQVTDFLTPEVEDEEFVHLDMILDRFVADLAERKGIEPHTYREALRAA